jgi:pimeloyl-ACP methyl ester carboxylesterase
MRSEQLHFPAEKKNSPIFLFIPGNPGAVQFYLPYLEELYKLSNHSMHIYCIGHASHSTETASELRYNLQQQTEQKIQYARYLLEQYPTSQIILAGHSVGAHICLEVMKTIPSSRLLKTLLLFPTVRNIASSSNGIMLTPVFRYMREAVWFLVYLIFCIPHVVLRFIFQFYTRYIENVDSRMPDAVMSIIHPDVAVNIVWMAHHEMSEIRGANDAYMQSVQDKLVFYFGENDSWVNNRDITDIRAICDRADIYNCTEGHMHAFAIDVQSSKRIAELCWNWCRQIIL